MCYTFDYADDILAWRKLELRSGKFQNFNFTRESRDFRTTIAMLVCRRCYDNCINPWKGRKRRQCDVEGCKKWARRRFDEFELQTDFGAMIPKLKVQPFICNDCYEGAEPFVCQQCEDDDEDDWEEDVPTYGPSRWTLLPHG